jgi:hypothetical protein
MLLRISLTIFVLLALAIGTRMYRLAYYGLNSDETVTLCVINGFKATGGHDLKVVDELPTSFSRDDIRHRKTYRNVVNATIRDNGNSLAYNLFLSWWTKVFGNTNYSIRFLSLVFGVLTVILGYYFARQLFNERTAMIAGVILCLHPLMIEYSQLARALVPATFFGLLSTYSLYQVAVSKRHLWLHIPLYVIGVILSMLSHYLVLPVLLSHALLVLFFHSHKKALVQYAIMGVAIAGLFSIWLFNGGLEGLSWMGKQNEEFVRDAINQNAQTVKPNLGIAAYRFGLNTVKIFGSEFQTMAFPKVLIFGYLLFPAVILFFGLRNIRKSEYFRQAMFVLFPIAMYFVFTLFMAFNSGHTTAFDSRYICFVLPMASIILAFGFDRMLESTVWIKRLAYAGMAGLTAVMVVSAFPHLVFQVNKKGGDPFPYHHAADMVEKRFSEGDLVLYNNTKDALLTNLYINKKVDILQHVDTSLGPNLMIIKKDNVPIAEYEFTPKR